MIQLKSELSLPQLMLLIKSVVAGTAGDYTFLDTSEPAYVSVHETVFDSDAEIIAFSREGQEFLTAAFGKTIKGFRNDLVYANYSIFASLFSNQAGLVRILWLNNKILSVLVGSKPTKIVEDSATSNSKKIEKDIYNPYYFGFSENSKVNLSLLEGDKEALMTVPSNQWLVVIKERGVHPNNPEANKSLAVSEGYIRHGSLEKIIGSNDIAYLMYPKNSGNFFTKGGTGGTGLPHLIRMLAGFEYADLLETQLLTNNGDWNRDRNYDNSIFLTSTDISQQTRDKIYFKLSFSSAQQFIELQKGVKERDLIKKKHSVLSDEDSKKYFDNPRYDIVFSPDKTMFYIAKSDKLKATALQTRITKAMREDFIKFLNWLGYFQLAADLEGVNLTSFYPAKLAIAKTANWVEHSLLTLAARKPALMQLATEQYRKLYMNERSSINPLTDSDMFMSIFGGHTTGTRYNRLDTDPWNMLFASMSSQYSYPEMLSFNKKFALDINLVNVLIAYARTDLPEQYKDTLMYFDNDQNIMSFLTTNFILTDKVEQSFEKTFNNVRPGGAFKTVHCWSFDHDIIDSQLLKTCVTLSPEALAIFNCVANLTSPTDIMAWLELSRNHFTEVLPTKLETKYGITTKSRISALLSAGIDYYITILSAAEPFSNKLLNAAEDSEE